MKIIEKGNWENPWSMEMVCPEAGCNAKLLVEEKDVKPMNESSGYYISCVICEKYIPVPCNSIPVRVRRIADKVRKYSSSWD